MLRAWNVDWVTHFGGHFELHRLIWLGICIRCQTFVDILFGGLHLSIDHNIGQPRVDRDAGRSLDHFVRSVLQLGFSIIIFPTSWETFHFKGTRAFWFLINWKLGRFAYFRSRLPSKATETSSWIVWVHIIVAVLLEDGILGEHAWAHNFDLRYLLAHLDQLGVLGELPDLIAVILYVFLGPLTNGLRSMTIVTWYIFSDISIMLNSGWPVTRITSNIMVMIRTFHLVSNVMRLRIIDWLV